LATVPPFQLLSVTKRLASVTLKALRAKTPAMKSFELHVARALLRRACHWLSLRTLLCLSWAMAFAAPTVELLRDP